MNQVNLLSVMNNKEIYGKSPSHETVTALVNDHRQIVPGACFIAIKGQNFDGHSVLGKAVQSGAKILIVEELPMPLISEDVVWVQVPSTYRAQAILANHFFEEPSTKLDLVAVTGTNGKTTTTTMISELLTNLGHRTGLIGTLHYKVDQTYYPAINTTPDALKLQSLFKEMVDHDCDDAIIEASSHALALGRIWYTDVNCAIFTNISREHLDFHKTMDHYAYAKSLLFAHLGEHFEKGQAKLAVINADDAYADLMMQASGAEIATYSLKDPSATAYAHSIESLEDGIRFVLDFKGQSHSIQLPMLGSYNVANYMAAFLCLALYYHFSVEDILQATEDFTGVRGRMQMIDEGQDFQVIVDFAHTPDALENVLTDLNQHKRGRLITMMGHSGGNRDSGMRPDLGDILFKYSDWVVLTADNPRHENVTKICQEMRQNHDEIPYTIIEDRQEAIAYILDQVEANDTVLFAGKGGEPYQVIGDEYVPFDEIEIVRQLLHNRGNE
ncbi:UDP-N-acetylmuramoyl-L-alanyl-D-glutamate--2,6-diaminopimelate ligase [Ignavigranum ruoffiae]|uniref:UDP-N-acetylmuramoyl-L-alanyl-D-glutamate--2, 6-diaminopimelate ligase n=1 Tax=Ignavigranum ruoffiae TaxID=89093 RepID=UPI002065F80B|nr:UDP-N-acetylmuramoyl-L-alanyl-D-glutamate--2,6-diaminopimelate ligase [Ignavigranum ruoffiae]UPQ85309.1 UDP-N-acetylmuramoyl-L-alanyl-D-glutamate--2,6-diaminopimelate ligase [Ignavigranum ruoffiae]